MILDKFQIYTYIYLCNYSHKFKCASSAFEILNWDFHLSQVNT